MLRVILYGLAAGALIVGCSEVAHGQSCYRSRTYYPPSSYSYPSYSYAPSYSYSYSAPAYVENAYVEPVKKAVKEYKEEAKHYYFVPVVALYQLTGAKLPSYGAAFVEPPPEGGNGATPPGQTPKGAGPPRAPAAPDPVMQQIIEELKGLRAAADKLDKRLDDVSKRLEVVEKRERGLPREKPDGPKKDKEPLPPPDKQPKDEPTKLDVKEVNRLACAACHQAGREKDDRGREFDVPDKFGGGVVLSDEKGEILFLTPELREAVQQQLNGDDADMPKTNSLRAKAKGITKKLTPSQKQAWFDELDRQVFLAGKRKAKADREVPVD